MSLSAVLVLAIGTFALRLAGPVLGHRVRLPERARSLLTVSSIVLLAALVAITALTEGHGFAGWARTGGVLTGAVLAVRRLPFPAVVVAAAATTAVLRVCGVP